MVKIFLFISLCAWSIEFNPYYSYTLQQGYNFGPNISSSFGSGIINDIGLGIKFDKKNSLTFLYEASYEGPGLKEKGAFQDRYQDHILSFLYKRRFSKILLKTGFDYVKSLSRSGISEDWEGGDYNYDKIGIGLDLLSSFKNIKLKIASKVSNIKYPNYTYLLSEIDPEYSLPRYDHRMYKLLFEGNYIASKVLLNSSFDMLFRNYKNEYIKNSDGVDTNEKQKDKTYTFNGGISYPLAKNLTAGIDASLSFLRSNYREVKFSSTGTAILKSPSFYNYNLIGIIPWISYGKNPKLNLSYSFEAKNFSNQRAEDKDGNWLLNKRKDRAGILSIEACKPINKQVSLVLSYGIKSLSSNMERQGYNTTYNSLGFKLGFEY